MPLYCPECDADIDADDVNVQANIAKCRRCGNVFRPGAVLGRASAPPDEPAFSFSPSERPPEGSKVRVEQFGDDVHVRFPPAGFSVGLVFLMAFAVAWWSFLSVFVGFGVGGLRAGEGPPASDPAGEAAEEAAPGDAAPKEAGPAEVPPHEADEGPPAESPPQPGGEPEGGQDLFAAVPWFLALFMTPFFLAGFGMVFAILWQLFGRTQVRFESMACTCRSALFGLGRTHRATPDETRVRWSDQPLASPTNPMQAMRTMQGNHGRILLTLGSWEKAIGETATRREQEWVYGLLTRSLRRLQGGRRIDGPSPPTM